MKNSGFKAWLYLLPAMLFLGFFMVYPLIDVFVYSFEEGYNSASQTFFGTGLYNYSYVLHDPFFLRGDPESHVDKLCKIFAITVSLCIT